MNAFQNCTNRTNEVILTLLLKLFALFMVEFDHKQTGSDHKLLSFVINCANIKHMIYCKMDRINNKYHIIVVIKDNIYYNVGIYWLIHTKETNELILRRNLLYGFKPGLGTTNQFVIICTNRF